MNKFPVVVVIFVVVLITSSVLMTRDFRVSKVPNGGKFSCATCHTSSFGGGDRNNFGKSVESLVPTGSIQDFWGPALAGLDSDGDGFSNGVELQDPNGAWKTGQANPGNLSLVTNPGDPNSKPTSTSVADFGVPSEYRLLNNYPNPFNPSTKIAFEIPQQEKVTLTIYNISGQVIKTLVNENLSAGRFERVWNGNDEFGNQVASGIYIYKLNAGNFEKSAHMILLK